MYVDDRVLASAKQALAGVVWEIPEDWEEDDTFYRSLAEKDALRIREAAGYRIEQGGVRTETERLIQRLTDFTIFITLGRRLTGELLQARSCRGGHEPWLESTSHGTNSGAKRVFVTGITQKTYGISLIPVATIAGHSQALRSRLCNFHVMNRPCVH